MSPPLSINEHIVLPESDLRWTAVRASGPGGQNVNKVSSKIELRFDVAGTEVLDALTKERLRVLAGSKLGASGELLITSQRTRDQAKNLDDAREKLKDLVLRSLYRAPPRRPTRPSRARVRARIEGKRKQGEKKASRQSRPE